jgi:hypothetical protein
MEHHPDFAVWREGDGEVPCGSAVWLNHGKSPSVVKRLSSLESGPQGFLSAGFAHEDVRQVSLTRLVAEVFKWLEGSLEFERLVQLAALLLDVRDHPPRSFDEEGDLSESCLTPAVLRGRGWQHRTGHQ